MRLKSVLKKSLIEPTRMGAMLALSPLELALSSKHAKSAVKPCFIIGPPRSGTTLFYQMLCDRFRFAYISNLAHRFYWTPVATTRAGSPYIRTWRADFESRYGHVAGWAAPNEGGYIWCRWFPPYDYLDETFVEKMRVEPVQRMVSGIAGVLEAPFINKNVIHSVHIRVLDAIFPECLFISVRRDPLANVRSIVHGRSRGLGPQVSAKKNVWWSVKPRRWTDYRDRSSVEQACAQVYYTRRDIEEDIAGIGEDRHMTIDYEQLCRDPVAALSAVSTFFLSHGVQLEERNAPPAPFEVSTGRPLDNEGERLLERHVARLWH